MTEEPLVQEIEKAQRVFGMILGQEPRYYRSPMGLSNPHLKRALERTDLQLIAWDVRTFDKGKTAVEIFEKVAGQKRRVSPVRDGSIVLLHDGGRSVEELLQAVERILQHFQALGYSFVNLDELFGVHSSS